MSYNQRIGWKDHVVQRPRTYTEVTNQDGSKTFTAAPGEVLQQGTPQSATNFNTMDEALQHISVAFDEMYCVMQAELRKAQADIVALQAQVTTLAAYHTE